MHNTLIFLMFIALGATLFVLIFGIFNMFSVSPQASHRSNKLMQWRIAAQIIVLVIFTFILLLGKNH